MTKLVLLDIGKVLIDFDFQRAVQSLQKAVPVDLVKLAKLFKISSLTEDFDRGTIAEEPFFQAIQKEMNFPMSLADFTVHWNCIFMENKEMVDLALRLKKNYMVSILTNTNPWHVAELKKNHPWVFEFQDFIASCEVKLMKPDPEIYRLALRRAKVRPEEVFYVDDIAENIVSAEKLGIDVVRFRSYAVLLKEIEKRNLKF